MVYMTGDLHGTERVGDLLEFRDVLSVGDYIIICGDFGLDFYEPKHNMRGWMASVRALDSLTRLPCDILFVDGNHENFNRLNKYPAREWHGGKVHQLRDNVYHLMRGQVFEINNKTFFTFGGARSIDKEMRKPNVSWWVDEMPSKEEYVVADRVLSEHNYKVDYIITHCAPTSIMKQLDLNFEADEVTNYLERVKKKTDYKYWYYGHYHRDLFMPWEKASCLYRKIEKIKFMDY